MSQPQHATDPGADPNIGLLLQDRYRILRKVGEGGMGAVYEAEHELIKKRVAIKCLHAQFAMHPEIVARFHREALAVTSIGHQNIVEVTDMGRFPDQSVFLVLEFLEGRDWAHDIERHGPQRVGSVVRIMEQVCDALTAAHSKDIVHRDLKPENIYLIERNGSRDFVKVVDFGISKFKDPAAGHSMTQTGAAMGTPYFMSPEQAQGRKDIDHRSDIYSLGVVMFQALTGQYPFDDEAYPMLVVKVCTEPAPRADLFRRDLPARLVEVVDRCLRKSPAERFQTCAELRQALAPFRDVDVAPDVDADAPKTSSFAASAVAGPIVAHTDPEFAASQVRLARAATVAATTAAPAHAGTDPDLSPSLPTSSRLPLVAGIAALVSVVAVAAVMLTRPDSSATPVESPPVVTPTPPPIPTQQPEPLAAPPQAPPATSVTVEISTEPTNAEVYLDGMRIPNPFDGELPQTTTARRLEVRADGYTTIAQDLVLQFPQRVRLRLERGTGIDDRSTASAARSPAGRSSGSSSTPTAGETPTSAMGTGALPPAPTPAPTPPPTVSAPPATPPAAGDTSTALKQIRL